MCGFARGRGGGSHEEGGLGSWSLAGEPGFPRGWGGSLHKDGILHEGFRPWGWCFCTGARSCTRMGVLARGRALHEDGSLYDDGASLVHCTRAARLRGGGAAAFKPRPFAASVQAPPTRCHACGMELPFAQVPSTNMAAPASTPSCPEQTWPPPPAALNQHGGAASPLPSSNMAAPASPLPPRLCVLIGRALTFPVF